MAGVLGGSMSARSGAIVGGILLLALTACGRAPPIQSANATSSSSAESGSEPVVLAGGPDELAAQASGASAPVPPASDAPAEPDIAPAAASPSPPDPLEPVNRRLYAVDAVLGAAIRKRPHPARLEESKARPVVHAAHNLLNNLDEPSVVANDLLQRKLARAGSSAVRFVINSTVGVVGLFDVASRLGLKRHDNNLDRTLASYGAPAGPYVYLPIAGPATLRATVALAAEGYLYPAHWLHLATGVSAALKGAGYAKLAGRVIRHADGVRGDRPGEDPYVRTRTAYFASRTDPAQGGPAVGGERPTALASVSQQDH